MNHPQNTHLGKQTNYAHHYQPNLLHAISRLQGRNNLPNYQPQNIYGFDLWTSFEVSWLNLKGKPQVAIAEFVFPHDSDYIIESKSFKLYLNSLNQEPFAGEQAVIDLLTKDLSRCAGTDVTVTLHSIRQPLQLALPTNFTCIDDLDIEINQYQYAPELLKEISVNEGTINEQTEEFLCSHLLKSNCLVTNQPDWGSVYIHYIGQKIDAEKLLQYLISFRFHNEFHEQCVERIFTDLMATGTIEKLTVFARYTRRGGLDINPFRSNFEKNIAVPRLIRQ